MELAPFKDLPKGDSKSQPPNLDEGILLYSNPIFLNGWMCQTSHISYAETYSIPKVFLPKQTKVHAPWVLVISS